MLLSQPAGMNTPVPALEADSDGGLSSLAIGFSCATVACSKANEGHCSDHTYRAIHGTSIAKNETEKFTDEIHAASLAA